MPIYYDPNIFFLLLGRTLFISPRKHSFSSFQENKKMLLLRCGLLPAFASWRCPSPSRIPSVITSMSASLDKHPNPVVLYFFARADRGWSVRWHVSVDGCYYTFIFPGLFTPPDTTVDLSEVRGSQAIQFILSLIKKKQVLMLPRCTPSDDDMAENPRFNEKTCLRLLAWAFYATAHTRRSFRSARELSNIVYLGTDQEENRF